MGDARARATTLLAALVAAWEDGPSPEERAHAGRVQRCLDGADLYCGKEAAADPLGLGWVETPPGLVSSLHARKTELDFAQISLGDEVKDGGTGFRNSAGKASGIISALLSLVRAEDLHWKVPSAWKAKVKAEGGTETEVLTVRSAMLVGKPEYGAVRASDFCARARVCALVAAQSRPPTHPLHYAALALR